MKRSVLKSVPLVSLLTALTLMLSCENNGADKSLTETQISDQTEDRDTGLRLATGPVYEAVDVIPEPEGGMKAFYEYVGKNLIYPAEARTRNIEGKVLVEFVVSHKGSVENVRVVKGIGPSCDTEAVAVISKSPAWIPGRKDGKDVNVKMILPITFKIMD